MNSTIKYLAPWWLSQRYMYIYDAQNNIQETLVQDWYSNKWNNVIKTTYYYNTQNYCIESLSQFWNFGWIDSRKTFFNYDAQNNIIEQWSQIWEGHQWVNDMRYSYLYNSQNNMLEELIQWWKYTEQWANWRNYTYQHDSIGNAIEKLCNVWDPDLEEWYLPYKWIFTYDAQNNITEELYHHRNVYNEWVYASRISYTYDENHNASVGLSQKWENNTWKDFPGDFNLHYNNMKSIWGFTDVTDIHKFSATYIKMGSQSIQDHSIESAIKLYPNPVSHILHVETSNVAPEIKIFSIQGVLLLQTKGNQIDLSSLANGIYFAEVDKVFRKVVKQ